MVNKAVVCSIAFVFMLAPCGGSYAEHGEKDKAAATDVVNGDIGAKIDAYMKGLESLGFCGAVLVARGDQILLNKGYGLADRKNGVPNTAETVFKIGSITKQFTAAAIMKLEMQGKLNTNDPIGKYLDNVPDDKRDVTLHQLLTHTAGFVEYTGGDYEPTPRDEAVRIALDSPLLSTPGEQFNYSNAGYSVLAAIVEIVSGMPYEDFVRENLFLPAGMQHTGYRAPEWSELTVSRMYVDDTDNGTALERDYPYWNLLGNGGIMSTTYDMFLWHRALMGDGILSAQAKQKLYTPALNDYAYGWDSTETPYGRLINHDGGNDLGANSNFMRYVDRDVVIYYTSNRRVSAFTILFLMRNALVKMAFGEEFGAFPAAAEVEGFDAQELTGRYFLDSGEFIDARVISGRLVLVPVGQNVVNSVTAPPEEIASRCVELNAKAVPIVDAIAAGDYAPLSAAMANPQRLETWRTYLSERLAGLGAVGEYLVLGTTQAWWGADEGLVTFVNIVGDRGRLVFRFHWNERGIWGLGGGAIDQPVTLVCQPRSLTEIAAYEPALGRVVPVTLRREGDDMTLILETASGELRAVRRK